MSLFSRPTSRILRRALSTVADGSDTQKAQALLKRFWKNVDISRRDDGLVVGLDKRPLKTPGGNTLVLPHNRLLAAALIAHEWDTQTTVLKPHALPMTSLASRAIDAMRNSVTRDEVQRTVLSYLDTDAVCFHHDDPPPLVALQNTHWDPLLEWTRNTFSVRLNTTASLLPPKQPAATKQTFSNVMSALDEWQLAALERVTMSSKSLVIGLALVKRHLDVDQAARAAHVEVNSQIERWGEVEDTHDVDYRDIRRQLGSAACLLAQS